MSFRPRERGRRRAARALPALTFLAIVGSWLAATGWLAVGGGDDTAQRVVADVLPAILDVGAAGLALGAAWAAGTRRARGAWLTIAISMAVYATGDGLYAWYELVLGEIPFPSFADLAYVAYYPIVVAALLSFPASPMNRSERLRLAIDSAIVVIGGAMVVWQSVLRPALESLDSDPVKTALAMGYPAGDLILLFGVAAIALRRTAGVDARALTALVGGLFLVLVADIGYGQLSLAGLVSSQHWTDVLYMASTTAIAAAAFLQLRSPGTANAGPVATIPAPLVYLPYLALAAGYGTLLATAVGSPSETQMALLLGAAVLTVLVLVRQELVLRENSLLLADQARRESEARFRALARDASDAIVLVDPSGVVVDATETVKRVLGVEAASLIGRPITRFAHADDAARLAALIADTAANQSATGRLEWKLWDRSGRWRQVETVAANMIDDPAIGQIVLTSRDVHERRVLEQQLQHVARHDMLTGLPNRALFLDRLDHALISGVRHRAATVVLVLNIDGFRRINDSLGHAVGDRLLKEVARRLEATLQEGDTCARLGGDEFALLPGRVSSAGDGRPAAERMLGALDEPFVLAEAAVRIAGRVGIAASDRGGGDATALLRNATVAMSQAKGTGRERVAVFEPRMQEALESRFELEADLRQGIERNELVLQYQPIVDLATGRLAGTEALVRWDHPTRGRLAPGLFIPLAEETALIEQIGAWVLRTACAEVTRWAGLARAQVPRVSVNLSPHQVGDPQLPWRIKTALAEARAAPGWLALEITESLLMDNTDMVIERLHAIRSLGVAIAIDDFGTGYSSLAYLQQFPMTQIKIDRSFVAPLNDPSRGSGIVRAMVEIGQALGMATVAEGIETSVQLERLRALGCSLGQGYLLGRPMDPDAIANLVARREPAWPMNGPVSVTPAAARVSHGRSSERRRNLRQVGS